MIRFRHHTARSRTVLAASISTLLVLAAQGNAQFTNKITTTPVIIQDGQGPAGDLLPYDGLQFCCPTAVAMSLSYLGLNGFNQIAPASPTANDELNLVEVLSGLMGTDPIAHGTAAKNILSGLDLYLAAKGIGTADFSLTAPLTPTVASLAALNQPGTVVDLRGGFYLDSDDMRASGHCIALLGAGADAQGDPAPNTLVVNNPEPNTLLPEAAVPANSLQTLTTSPTSGALIQDGAIELDSPAGDPNYWQNRGETFVIQGAIVLTVNPSQQSANNPALAKWTFASTKALDLDGGSLSVLAPIQGAGGISASRGTLELEAADSSRGKNTVQNGTLRSDVSAGLPFGSGALEIEGGALQIAPAGTGADVNLKVAGGSGHAFSFEKGARLEFDPGNEASLTVTLGGSTNGKMPNFVHATGESTLVIVTNDGIGALGTTEKLLVAGSAANLPTPRNGMVSPAVVATHTDFDFSSESADFLNYGANGFVIAAYTEAAAVSIGAAGADAVYDADAAQTIASNATAQVYALKVGAYAVSGGAGSKLEIGSQTGGQAGVILNGGTISTASLSFGAAEAFIYTSEDGGTISSTITGKKGLVVFGPGPLTLQGANTYSGGTFVNGGTLQAANTAGSATGNGLVTVLPRGTLEITGSSAKAGGAGGITVQAGGALLLNGGTAAGPLTLESGSHLFGAGTISGAANLSGTIGGSATDPDNAPYAGVEDLTFSGSSANLGSQAIYDWKLNALSDLAAEAGIDWSELSFTGAKPTVHLGTTASTFHLALDLGAGVSDPNSGDPFWNQPHQWVIANDPNGFGSIHYDVTFPAYSQGKFAATANGMAGTLEITYAPVADATAIASPSAALETPPEEMTNPAAAAPVPEPGAGALFALAAGFLAGWPNRGVRRPNSASRSLRRLTPRAEG